MDSGGALDDVRSWPFLAPVSSLGAVVSWEEDDSDGEARAVLAHSTLPVAGGGLLVFLRD